MLSLVMYGSKCCGSVIKYCPIWVMYSWGEKLKSGMSGSLVSAPADMDVQIFSSIVGESTIDNCSLIGWNKIVKVLDCKSWQVDRIIFNNGAIIGYDVEPCLIWLWNSTKSLIFCDWTSKRYKWCWWITFSWSWGTEKLKENCCDNFEIIINFINLISLLF